MAMGSASAARDTTCTVAVVSDPTEWVLPAHVSPHMTHRARFRIDVIPAAADRHAAGGACPETVLAVDKADGEGDLLGLELDELFVIAAGVGASPRRP